ncbi:MAG: MFS transporter [Micropruina sp.]
MVFALSGATVFSWLARIPTIRDLLLLSTVDLGWVLLIGSIGALVSVLASGVLMARLGSARVFAVGAVLTAVGFTLMGVGPQFGSLPGFVVGIMFHGVGNALLMVPMNVETARVERAVGRTIIPEFHASFSAGAALGALAGATGSYLAIPVGVQFGAVALGALVWRLASLRSGFVLPVSASERLVPTSGTVQAPSAARIALQVWREPRTLLIGLVALTAAFSEGSANNWLSIAIVDGFGVTESVGGFALGVMIAAMTAVRLLGTRLMDRYGRVVTLRASGLLAVVGLLTFGFAPDLPLAVIGVLVWGAGAALVFPIAVAAASDHPAYAAARVSVITSMATVASLIAPPLVGIAAGVVGARLALLLILTMLIASILISGRTAPCAAPLRESRRERSRESVVVVGAV